MFDTLLKIIAPHHCYSCQKIGTLLCENCKYDIVSEPFGRCVQCLTPIIGSQSGTCRHCTSLYTKSWAVGERHDALEALLNGYKFSYEREAATVLADMLDSVLPNFTQDTIVTYIPTISQHIRQRGYDHALLIAKTFAIKRHLPFETSLLRVSSNKQLGASKKQRETQAKRAFVGTKQVSSSSYLLIDDIFTTGATMKYATKALLDAGADDVSIAVIARQPLD